VWPASRWTDGQTVHRLLAFFAYYAKMPKYRLCQIWSIIEQTSKDFLVKSKISIRKKKPYYIIRDSWRWHVLSSPSFSAAEVDIIWRNICWRQEDEKFWCWKPPMVMRERERAREREFVWEAANDSGNKQFLCSLYTTLLVVQYEDCTKFRTSNTTVYANQQPKVESKLE
jgi:hypothetical protein